MLRDIFLWHFVEAPRRMLKILRGLLLFILHYFAIPFHLVTFIKPWRRQFAHRGRGFNFKEWATVLMFNTVGRFIGMLFRTVLIITGAIVYVLVAFLGACAIIIWIGLPAFVVGGVIWAMSGLY